MTYRQPRTPTQGMHRHCHYSALPSQVAWSLGLTTMLRDSILLHTAAGTIRAPRVEGVQMMSLSSRRRVYHLSSLLEILTVLRQPNDCIDKAASGWWWSGNCSRPRLEIVKGIGEYLRHEGRGPCCFVHCPLLLPAHFNSADAETWLCKFSVVLITTYSTAANCSVDLANDDLVDVFICEVNAWFQPFANKVWFLRYAQEVATVVAGHSLSSHLSSAAVLPVLSLLTAGLLAVVLPVAVLPSLLPLRQVQPAPSNSPVAVAATVPPSAPQTPGITDPAAPVALSGSRRAHFKELGAVEGEDEELLWICESDCYHKCFAQELAAHAHCDPLPARAPCASRTPRVAHAPSMADNFEPSWDPCLDPPGPAYDILVGGHFYFPGLESASAALFWHSEVAHAEGHYLAAKWHLQFARSMLSDLLMHCIAPLLDSSWSQCMQFSCPLMASADPDVTGPTDDVAPRSEGSSSSKGKGWVVVPMDEDVPEQPASPSEGGDGNGWDGILG
ncbi:hypothetical protein V8E53_006211 [Lactarius tabidus]